jgi:hypothetical protein
MRHPRFLLSQNRDTKVAHKTTAKITARRKDQNGVRWKNLLRR